MGPAVLFTHLKIILLQCFQQQSSVFSNNKLYPNGLIVSLSQQLPQSNKAEDIEAIAATQALELGLELGLEKVVLEGDFELTIKALAREVVSLVPFDHLIQDARFFVICFSQLLYSHTRREGNKVAHNLARFFKNITDFIV